MYIHTYFVTGESMTQDEIIKLAKQADVWVVGVEPYQSQLERFAKLVAQHEREACAKVCEDKNTLLAWTTYAQAIRERSQA